MATNRLQRELENRELQERPKQWMPPELLPEPNKQAGFAYRWIRVSMLNASDPRNISAKFREGWEPVHVDEQPQYKLLASREGPYKDNIEIGGLLLCKIPEEIVAQRMAYENGQTAAQAEAVDNNLMRQSDSRMPIFMERKSTVTFGSGGSK